MTDEGARHTPPSVVLTWQRLAAVCASLLVALTTASSGQTPSVDTSPAAAAARAFNAGQYDQIDGLLRSATDERSTVLRARAHVARGRYAEAEKLLAGVVASNPAGDATLELGLLQQYLGRRQDAARTLGTVLARGGVFVTGGIAPRIASRLERGGFVAAFNAKGRYAELMADIPLYLVMNEKLGLLGATAIAMQLS